MPIYELYKTMAETKQTAENAEQMRISNLTADARYRADLAVATETAKQLQIDNKTREVKNIADIAAKQSEINERSQSQQIRAAEFTEWQQQAPNRKIVAELERVTAQSGVDLYMENPKQFARYANAEKELALSNANINTYAMEQERRYSAVNSIMTLYEKTGGNLEMVNKYLPEINQRYRAQTGQEIIPGVSRGMKITPEIIQLISAEKEQLVTTRDYLTKKMQVDADLEAAGLRAGLSAITANSKLEADNTRKINLVLADLPQFGDKKVELDTKGNILSGPQGVKLLQEEISAIVRAHPTVDASSLARDIGSKFFERNIDLPGIGYSMSSIVPAEFVGPDGDVFVTDEIIDSLTSEASGLEQQNFTKEQIRTRMQSRVDTLIQEKIKQLISQEQ